MNNTKKQCLHHTAKLDIVNERIAVYDAFVKNLTASMRANDFVQMASFLNGYMDYAKQYEFEPNSIYPTRTKYYSSILEELPVHIVKDQLEVHIKKNSKLAEKDFYLGSYCCLVRVGVAGNGKFFYESKMIDFALALKNTEHSEGWYVPLMGLEIKRYLDKTMFHTIEHTRRVLSEFRPKTYYGLLIEDESRAKDVVQNSTMHNREFVLTGAKRPRRDEDRNPIGVAQLQHLITSIRSESIIALDSTLD